MVICDDQSSDGTVDFARELSQGDERFRFIQNPRRFGLVGNWNNCVAVSRGEWFKFVFQDDLLLPLCLERMVAVAAKSNAFFVACRRGFQFEPGTTDEASAVAHVLAACKEAAAQIGMVCKSIQKLIAEP